jgi:hypothetical protein
MASQQWFQRVLHYANTTPHSVITIEAAAQRSYRILSTHRVLERIVGFDEGNFIRDVPSVIDATNSQTR